MNGSLPKVSIVCAWYNRADYICETIDSLLAQDYPNYDITVINDGSSDPRVRNILDGYSDHRLQIIHQENAGFTLAIRRAIAESDGEYVAIQGAGDVSLPGRLSAQVAFLKERPDFAVIGCRYVNQVKRPNGDGPRTLARVRTFEPTARDIMRGNPIGHGEALFRRVAYDQVGGYRTFFENSQDKDLWMRLSHNYRIGILDECLYQRNIFSVEGLASNFEKTLRQIAYSRLADLCYAERLKSQVDSVEQFGALAPMRVPRGLLTTYRIVRAVKQVSSFDRMERHELAHVKELFGWVEYAAALVASSIFRSRSH